MAPNRSRNDKLARIDKKLRVQWLLMLIIVVALLWRSIRAPTPAQSNSSPRKHPVFVTTTVRINDEWNNRTTVASTNLTTDGSLSSWKDAPLDWSPNNETWFEVCFITSVYAPSRELADQPPNIEPMKDSSPDTFRFFAYTNLPDLEAPGWTIVVRNFTHQYRRFITQSRWPKFMAWTDVTVQRCQAVFYMDGFCAPKEKHIVRYRKLARLIHDSKFGLAQNKHEYVIGPMKELRRIVEKKKDIASNVNASIQWLTSQPDFNPNCTLYSNHYIAYDPRNLQFQKASQFFWDHYSLEQDSCRDQPLWCYVLDRFGINPIRLGTPSLLFREYFKNMGHAGHRYRKDADNEASASESSV